MSAHVRPYDHWLSRLQAAAWPDLTLNVLGRVGPPAASYPLISLGRRLTTGPSAVLTAGIHGDEPGGVEALTQLMERRQEWAARLNRYGLLIFPCANPSGYERGTRLNHDDIDLNRQFDHAAAPPEVALIRAALRDGRTHGAYRLSIEFHEDVDTDGFYLYELAPGQPYLGESIIHAVEKIWPINRRTDIEGMAAHNGIIRPDADRLLVIRPDHWPQAIYTYQHGTPSCLTFETPVAGFSLEQRAAIHLTALGAALDALVNA